jgi:FkbM family methyltransferase
MNKLKQVLRYVSHFGPRAGLQAARMLGRPGLTAAVQLPGLAHPFWARTGTSDVATFDEVFVAREYDLPFTNFSPLHILDLGANVGYASITFATRWPRARVLAVEPDAHNATLLARNTRAWPRIECFRAAVWARPARVCIANPSAAPNAFRMAELPDTPEETVEAYTIPQLLEFMGCDRLDLLKMDIEGAEAEILRHSSEWLDHVDTMVIELHDRIVPGCAEALFEALRGRHFRLEIVGANLAIDFRQ